MTCESHLLQHWLITAPVFAYGLDLSSYTTESQATVVQFTKSLQVVFQVH